MGLANDGGLLLPQEIPDARPHLDTWRSLSYPDLAFAVMQPFIGDSVPADDLHDLVNRSYQTFRDAEITPVRDTGPVHILELFHGPTLAFKDVALQFLGNLFEYLLQRSGDTLNIIGATSGDTGSAAIYGVRGKQNINIFIMHPYGKVSPVQERQMTTVMDDNVFNIAVKGTFDDGQRVLKELFNDLEFKRKYRLGAVNSVNWARVLAQIVYYFYGAFRVCERTGKASVQACVPTGNFGDIFAGYMAMRMGAPLHRLILATNENDILARFFESGRYQLGDVHTTMSPSMDIQVASNFERYLYYRVGRNPERVRSLMQDFAEHGCIQVPGKEAAIRAGTGSRDAMLDVIRRYYRQYEYLLDPHTAVGVAVGERYLSDTVPTLCLATAHPAKFKAAIEEALDRDLAHHETIDRLGDLPTRCEVLPADKDTVEAFIKQCLDG